MSFAFLRVLFTLLAVLAAGGCSSSKPAPYPAAPVELVVPFQPGGGSDVLARMIQSVVIEDRLLSQPLNIVNKPGGAGAIGLAYVAARQGDPYTLMTTIDTVVSVPLQPGYEGPSYRDLTIVAILAMDDMLVVVPGSSPFKTIEELIAYGKQDPGRLKLATNAAGGEDHIFGGMIERAAGVKFTYVHMKGGAEAMQNLMGAHVDIAVPNPSETLSQAAGGLVRILAVASARRLPILPDVPTLAERGIQVEYQMFRGVALPAGVPPDVVRYWEQILERVTKSDRWRTEYVGKLALTPQFQTGDTARQFIARTESIYRASLGMSN